MHIYENISPKVIGFGRVLDESFMPNAFLSENRAVLNYKTYNRKETKELFTPFTQLYCGCGLLIKRSKIRSQAAFDSLFMRLT
jgi:hypothetical protein